MITGKTLKHLGLLTVLATLGRVLLFWIPGATPILPIALFAGGLYGLDAAIVLAVIALISSSLILNFTYLVPGAVDSFTGLSIIYGVGLVVVGIFISTKILKIGKPKSFNLSALMYRVILASIVLEIGISLFGGTFFKIPDSFYHIIANIIGVFFIGLFAKETP
jgi:hypothetical protein